jgi:hypothetical protein
MFIYYSHHSVDIGHMIASRLVHGLIYGVISKTFHSLSLPVVMMISITAIAAIYWFFKRR